jgi:hypothetical protein
VPKRDQLLSEISGENFYGVLLAAQMGGSPNELQLIVQTAEYDASVEGLRERTRYVIRALGVREHKLSLGVFGLLQFSDDHPLLYHHNTPKAGVFFRGKVDNVAEVVLDISQAHASTFGPWRFLADDINRAAPLVDLLASGGGLLGEVPKPLAERYARVLEHHHVEHKLIEETSFEAADEHGRPKLAKLLLIDDGYIVALDFSVDYLGKV